MYLSQNMFVLDYYKVLSLNSSAWIRHGHTYLLSSMVIHTCHPVWSYIPVILHGHTYLSSCMVILVLGGGGRRTEVYGCSRLQSQIKGRLSYPNPWLFPQSNPIPVSSSSSVITFSPLLELEAIGNLLPLHIDLLILHIIYQRSHTNPLFLRVLSSPLT